jgi:hypothetical protein
MRIGYQLPPWAFANAPESGLVMLDMSFAESDPEADNR